MSEPQTNAEKRGFEMNEERKASRLLSSESTGARAFLQVIYPRFSALACGANFRPRRFRRENISAACISILPAPYDLR
jgi:hypothetical protein